MKKVKNFLGKQGSDVVGDIKISQMLCKANFEVVLEEVMNGDPRELTTVNFIEDWKDNVELLEKIIRYEMEESNIFIPIKMKKGFNMILSKYVWFLALEDCNKKERLDKVYNLMTETYKSLDILDFIYKSYQKRLKKYRLITKGY